MRVWGFVIIFLPILGLAQGITADFSSKSIRQYMDTYLDSDRNLSSDRIDKLVSKLESKKSSFGRDEDFVRFLFNKVHQQLLKNYSEFSSFEDLISKGEYNCLTGTVLYALLLEYFGYEYRIIETNYHIFLLAELGEHQALFEATDPLYGFVSEGSEIKNRIESYKKGLDTSQLSADANKNKTYHEFSFELYGTVTLEQVKGLLYYNEAVNAYNDHQLAFAINCLDKAIAVYHSPRMEEFAKVIMMTVSKSNLPATVKDEYMRKVRSLYKKKYEKILASN